MDAMVGHLIRGCEMTLNHFFSICENFSPGNEKGDVYSKVLSLNIFSLPVGCYLKLILKKKFHL